MTPQDLIQAFDALAEAPEGVARLRELVLQLAVRGRLVPQGPEDEPASALLERIAEEKALLVEALKIRRPKALPPVTRGEVPFDVPERWDWTRLGVFCHLEMGQSPPSKFYNQSRDGMPFFQGKADFGDHHPEARYWCVKPTKLAEAGDVLLSVRAPVGPTNVASEECCIGRGLAAVRPLGGVSTEYILWMLRAFEHVLEALGTGTTFRAISKKSIEPFVIPVPPLAEQQRIVARVDELMGLLDRLESARATRSSMRIAARDSALAALREADTPGEVEVAWDRLAERLDNLVAEPSDVEPLRQTVLQLAVRGQLVPQDPGDEPASVLLERIAEEKARLVKEGRIRKPKALKAPEEDELPFAVSQGWAWCPLGDLINEGPNNGWSPKSVDFDTGVRTLKLSATTRGTFDERHYKFVDADLPADSPLWLRPGDLLIQRSNTPEYVGMAAIYKGKSNKFIYPDLMMRCRLTKHISVDFVHKVLVAPVSRAWYAGKASGTSQSMVKLNQKSVASTPVPLPPLREQHRIVAKVDELMGILDRLEERLTAKTEVHDAFAAAAVHHLDA